MSKRLTNRLCATMSAALSTGRTHVPDGGRLVWQWFNDLCRVRSSSGFGPNPISYTEIEAYARLYRWPLEPGHVDMILAMDRVWMKHARGNVGTSHHNQPSGPGMEMTPDAFDAVFG